MPDSFIKDIFKKSSLEFSDGLYFQKNLEKGLSFENQYIQLRKAEGRVYDDTTAAKLPEVEVSHPLSKEWRIRKRSTHRLIQFLKSRQPKTVMELGCGNGWLIRTVHSAIEADCLGIDVNEMELRQAVRTSGHATNLAFVYADIFSQLFAKPCADVIILASVIQYFSDVKSLLERSINMLNPGGQVHILDSPFYSEETIGAARERSQKYFNAMGHAEMQFHYFHHPWNVLDEFNVTIKYNPDTLLNRLSQKVNYDSPFPWIVIEK
jgi:2-polyprenyl-3-methyl-5-hydroxy-6-metoxy-1,4-benzoquinol methylase